MAVGAGSLAERLTGAAAGSWAPSSSRWRFVNWVGRWADFAGYLHVGRLVPGQGQEGAADRLASNR